VTTPVAAATAATAASPADPAPAATAAATTAATGEDGDAPVQAAHEEHLDQELEQLELFNQLEYYKRKTKSLVYNNNIVRIGILE